MEFTTANEVRNHLKSKGVKIKVRVRWADNPFGGKGKFWVKPVDLPANATIIHACSTVPDGPNGVFSDNPDATKVYGELEEALKGTNAKVS